ncbi:conserved hypothetical protein [Vibrio chagasii]|nr:conserved hypothetical protein [Vibrio chagasii]CAH6905591.1 conserved hypothetical protein [Vibrio chagasii]CAH6990297.1 conserved hypothetical protein [Vibrio chagasii]CAH7013675.1 conserved hypothetical protein [Vibrio chagasii]
MDKKVYIICQDYPSDDNKYAMSYVHARVRNYRKIDSKVVSFSAKENYIYEGVEVLTSEYFEERYLRNLSSNDIIVSHAPNIKNHVRLLNKTKLCKIIFVIHGHEVLKTKNYYPKPYSWDTKKASFLSNVVQGFYDSAKVAILRKYFIKLDKDKRCKFIFVSDWMKKEFLENIKLKKSFLTRNSEIIFNPCSPEFLNNDYKHSGNKKYDVISIRPFDGSKYAVDDIVRLAERYPQLKFKLYGKGDYFRFNRKPNNMDVELRFLTPKEIIAKLDSAKLALMPTRLDAQGVMMCEMATYGIPLITSDLRICKEMLGSFFNIGYIKNIDEFDMDDFINNIDFNHPIDKSKFDSTFLLEKEENFILSEW